jgi:polysaccharide biosynthesis transport protein
MELKRYWQIILKRHRTLLWIIGVIVVTVVIGSLITTPVYMFYANILIKTSDPKSSLVGGINRQGGSNLPGDLAGLGIVSNDLVMYGQLAMIKNLSLVQKVISEMKLEKNKGQPYDAKEFLNPGTFSLMSQKRGVNVSLLQNTQVLQVQGFSSSPQEAANIANHTANSIVEFYDNHIRSTARESLKFIQENIPLYSQRLRQAETELAQYKIENHVGNLSYLREKLITSLVTLKDSAETAGLEKEESEKKNEQIRAKLKKIPAFHKYSQEYRSNPTLSYLREKLMDLESTLASNEVKLTRQHPTVRQSISQIAKLKEEYRNQAAKLFNAESVQRNSLFDNLLQRLGESEIDLAVRIVRQNFLNQQFTKKQKELDDLTQKEVGMEPLGRKVTALQTALNTLLAQEDLSRLASDLNLSNAVVIEKAALPLLSSQLKKYRWYPKRTLLACLALLSGLLLGLAVIFSQEYFEDSCSEPMEAEGYLNLPILTSLPELPALEAHTLEAVMGHVPWAQAVWALPDIIKTPDQGWPEGVWAVSSASAGDGKSLVAASLGWVLGLRGLRVLLVDLNFFHPTLASLWQLPAVEGVREVLQGTASLASCVRQVGPGELYLLPNGKAGGVLQPQWTPSVLAEWLAGERAKYDAVILDLPAVAGGEGAPWAALGEQILMVLAANHTSRFQAARAIEQIRRCHGRIKGLVFNRAQKYELRPIVSQAMATFMSLALVQRLAAWRESRKDKLWISGKWGR